jgi:Carboxypeptidase regulatory-like domain
MTAKPAAVSSKNDPRPHLRPRLSLSIAIVWLAVAPTAAYAQASIAGVVRDTSGAVMPGVTVEAASPALIEKIRSVVTDGTGQYRVVDLRPGTYDVTFTLPGFNTIKREGIELSGNFTATVNAEMRVGALEETVTVTGESPIVDVQSTRQQQTIDRDIITAIPTGRSFQSLATLIPAMVSQGGMQGGSQDVGGDRGPWSSSDRFIVHGGLVTDSRLLVEGLGVASASAGGASGTYYLPPVGTSQEIVISTSGGMGEAETGGVVVNIIPREGGNTIRGSFFVTGANDSMQSDNYSQALKDKGLKAPNRVQKLWEVNPAFGGPVFKDKLWYFLSGRSTGAYNYIAGLFYNLNAGNPAAWTYVPDPSRQAVDHAWAWSAAARLTWQATPRNKFNVFVDEQKRCVLCPGAQNGVQGISSPEATGSNNGYPNRVQQLTWSSPMTNRMLMEAGIGTYFLGFNWAVAPPMLLNLIGVNEQAGAIPGLNYRGLNRGHSWHWVYNWRASVSYVTGAHNTKIGYQGNFYDVTSKSQPFRHEYASLGLSSFRFNNGVPNQLTQAVRPVDSVSHLKVAALYAQDQWTVRRLTLQGSVRYDNFSSYFLDQQLGPTTFVPDPFVFPGQEGVNFNDVSVRGGAVYDLFGTGKTAVKIHLGQYMQGQESSNATSFGSALNPITRLAASTNRSWNDANRNYFPDCNLSSPTANGECGAMANQNFAKNVFSLTYDPEATHGWGVRPYSWEFATSIQHELLPRVALDVGYFRRWFGNFSTTDNLATAPSDYTLFQLPVPVDSRLPDSGGTVTVANINPDKFGQVREVMTTAGKYGKQTSSWSGMDFAITVRPQGGLFLQSGLSVGRTLSDNCEVIEKLPEIAIASNTPFEFCRAVSPFLPQVKSLWTYTIPRIDLQVSGTFQNKPGPEIQANYNAPNAVVAPALGRNLSGGAANMTVNLLPPLSTFGDRINQIDFRVAKILRFGKTRTQVTFDVFNALNSDVVQTQNNTFGPAWQTPTLIMTARLAKVSAQFDF